VSKRQKMLRAYEESPFFSFALMVVSPDRELRSTEFLRVTGSYAVSALNECKTANAFIEHSKRAGGLPNLQVTYRQEVVLRPACDRPPTREIKSPSMCPVLLHDSR
jgi:hypothetical protein